MASADGGRYRGLLCDWGGVLTTDLFASFRTFCTSEGLAPDALRAAFAGDEEAARLLVEFECGRLGEPDFERELAGRLGVTADGLIDRLFAGSGPDMEMIGAVEAFRAAGVPTGLVSNSWGTRRYPRDLMARLFDGVVISGEVGIRKPSRRIYALGAEAIGVAPEDCVFVDDLEQNLRPATELGMGTVHHRDAPGTIAALEDLLGVSVRD